jgi:DNA-binding NarL/FixJ family response regulator
MCVGLPDARTAPERTGGPVRVFIVDDQELVRHGLRSLLEQEGLDVVGDCGSAGEAGSQILEREAEVVVLDERLPDGTGIEVCRDIRSVDAALRCLLLTSHDDDGALPAVVLAGAAGYVLRQLRGPRTVQTILRAAAGDRLLAPGKLAAVKARLAKASVPGEIDDLTDEERAVLALIADDRRNNEISETLALEDATVRRLVSALLAKLGFRSGITVPDHARATPTSRQRKASPWVLGPGKHGQPLSG